ncbi:MAG: glycosyltransferase family 4 protein [Planctomycetota bacterium]
MPEADSPLRLLVVPSVYPSAGRPEGGIFVQALMKALLRSGASVRVVAPQPYGRGLFRKQPDDGGVPVERPWFLSYSNKRLTGRLSTFRWTSASFNRAVLRTAARMEFRPNLVYGHFLFPGGEAALKAAERFHVPAVVALGEGNPAYYEDHVGLERMQEMTRRLSAILCVNEANKAYSVERLGVEEKRVRVQPNAADTTLFYPRNRAGMRRRHGLPPHRPLIAFTGHFNENKGPLRVLEAIRSIPKAAGVFLGEGRDRPQGERVLFAGKVPYREMPEWLSAADLFVLPALREASSNAVAEALACGLPVVTSDLPTLRAMATERNARFVDPLDIPALAVAIDRILREPLLRAGMSSAALEHARSYTLDHRAGQILAWLRGLCPA